jgi:hypothetical protein
LKLIFSSFIFSYFFAYLHIDSHEEMEGFGSETPEINVARCKEIVILLQEHLTEKFPDARIRIHNGRNETIALAYKYHEKDYNKLTREAAKGAQHHRGRTKS